MLLAALHRHKMLLANCRAQAYYGPNMSGEIKGIQACILEISNIAFYSPCIARFRNLIER